MQNQKSLVIRMAEAEQELAEEMNTIMQRHQLPCFLLEPIVDKLHRQLTEGKGRELAQAQDVAGKEEAHADDPA